jgi:hypothetical protein
VVFSSRKEALKWEGEVLDALLRSETGCEAC